MTLTDYRDITALLQRHGFRFSKSMGQNFLTAAWVPQQIAAESGITAADGALEIGPGVGWGRFFCISLCIPWSWQQNFVGNGGILRSSSREHGKGIHL